MKKWGVIMDYLYCDNKLREKRKEKGLSQEGLALLVECSRSQISNIENGKFNTTILMAQNIAKKLDCAPVDIWPSLAEKIS